jgi:predicted metal-dependent enzyme (double-stranded beta helix superfamily)
MQLDIVEGSSQNIIPTNIQMGQTHTVTVAISNINNAPKNNVFTSVTLTLSSQNGHFSVNTPTVNVGTLTTGTATATWQITGVSEGSDALIISSFSDKYTRKPKVPRQFLT